MKLSQIEARFEALPPVPALGARALRVHQTIYERSGGRLGHRLGHRLDPVLPGDPDRERLWWSR